MPPGKVDLDDFNLQHDVIRDWSNHWNHLTYYPGTAGSYVASSDVPPKTMFRPGHSGGSKSFNSGAINATKACVLFHNAEMHSTQFGFTGSFTIEGFFKTDHDQSQAGMMAIVFKGCDNPAYLVSLNRPTAGVIQFTLTGSDGRDVSVAATDRNYADGQWHYFAARYSADTPDAGGTVSLLAGNEDRSCQRRSIAVGPEFTINASTNNLFIGRKRHENERVEGHFRGLIDEIRICRGAISDDQLIFAPRDVEK